MTAQLVDCEQIVRCLWPHLDGVLPENEQARVVAHLERCDQCRSHFDFARAFLDAVHRLVPGHAELRDLRRRVETAIAGTTWTSNTPDPC